MNMPSVELIRRILWTGNRTHELIVDQSGRVSALASTHTTGTNTVGTTIEGP